VNNQQVAEVFDRIGDLLEIKGESIYRVLAYRKAAESIRSFGLAIQQVWEMGQLRQIPGVGEAIEGKIDELLKTGKLGYFEKLKAEIPETLVEVLHVGDVGPKKAARFWKELGITTLEGLEAAAREGRLRGLAGMGARSEAKILENIEALKRRQTDRILLGAARPVAQTLLERLRGLSGVEAAEPAGSMRRWRETVGDIDLLAGSQKPVDVIRAFVRFPEVDRVLGQGDTKASVELANGMRVQLWVHPPRRFGTALQYATGSQGHNVRLRELAQDQGLSLSEHSFKRADGGEILCAKETEVYETLGLPWIPPELREDRGEIQEARAGRLPNLIRMEDVIGELHAHTDWSDGGFALEEMARAALSSGLSYLVVTDHSRSLGVANGLSIERLKEQGRRIDEVQRSVKGIRLLKGAEVEILADGRLDYPDEVLAELDLVCASLHTSLRQPREKVTARLLGAIENPHVDMIGHPTGRLVGARDAADLDIEAILQAAAERGVALEINASPDRLDLSDIHARRARDLGCLIAINTDAHRPEHFDLRVYGVGVARRAWLGPEQVVNTWPVDRLLSWLRGRGGG
jgi:DNA polymerase (family 10)